MKEVLKQKKRGIIVFENYFSVLFIFFFYKLKVFPFNNDNLFFYNPQWSKQQLILVVVQPCFIIFRKQFQSLFFVTIMILIFYIMKFLYEEGDSQCICHPIFYFTYKAYLNNNWCTFLLLKILKMSYCPV